MSLDIKFIRIIFVIFVILFLIVAQRKQADKALKVYNKGISMSQNVWQNKMVGEILTRMEKNLDFYEEDKWSVDVRGAFQLFMMKLNLKIALDNPRFVLYEHNYLSPLKKDRLNNIVNRTEDLLTFIRYRILARIPRLNMTRQVAALFIFTEVPWFHLLPSLASNNEKTDVTMLKRTIEIKLRLNQSLLVEPTIDEYLEDLQMKSNDSIKAHNITYCLEALTKNSIDEYALTNASKGQSVPMTQCEFLEDRRSLCLRFVHHGVPFQKMKYWYGHINFYRIVLLTAARLARNCYFFSPLRDRRILNFLCYEARYDIHKLSNISPNELPDSYYTESDILTPQALALVCLMNGYKKFMLRDIVDCTNSEWAWYDVGCYGPAGHTLQNITSPTPWWIMVRPNMHANNVCNRRQTAACFSYQSAILRGLVEIGDIVELIGPSTKKYIKPTAYWLPGDYYLTESDYMG